MGNTAQFTATIEFTLLKYIGNRNEMFPCEAVRMKILLFKSHRSAVQHTSSMYFDCSMTVTCDVTAMVKE
jgi:hypothetical protein